MICPIQFFSTQRLETTDIAMSIPFDSEPRRRPRQEDAVEREERLTRTFRDFPVRPAPESARLKLDSRQLTMALGWFSVAVGLAEVLAPRKVGRMAGLGHRPMVTRLCGLRQIANGVGLLSERAPTTFLWSRVAGDTLDLALLGTAIRSPNVRRSRIVLAATFLASVTALDIFAGQQSRRAARARAREPRQVDVSININITAEKLYAFWRNLKNLPRFLQHLHSVQAVDDRVTHWIANAPAGMLIEWDAEVVDDQPGKLIAWRTLPGSAVTHHGVVTFVPLAGNKGTTLRLAFEYFAPSEVIGAALVRLLGGNPEVQIARDLRRLKQLVEEAVDATAHDERSNPASKFMAALKG